MTTLTVLKLQHAKILHLGNLINNILSFNSLASDYTYFNAICVCAWIAGKHVSMATECSAIHLNSELCCQLVIFSLSNS